MSGIPLAFANGCLILEPAGPGDVSLALDWVLQSGMPFIVDVDQLVLADVSDTIDRLALVRRPETMPGMVLQPIPDPPLPPSGVVISEVDGASHSEFIDLLVANGLPAAEAAAAFPPSFVREPDVAMFVARLDGQPAGTSVAIRTGTTGGIYSVGTLETARRRGVGTAVTWAAIDAIRDWGGSAAVLQTSDMGLPIYRAMGFESVADYIQYGPPAS